MGLFRKKGRAYDAYARYIGKDVVIYFEDVRRESRMLFGRIVDIEANVIHLINPETGWLGCIDCDTCKIGQISTQEGWRTRNDN